MIFLHETIKLITFVDAFEIHATLIYFIKQNHLLLRKGI